MGRHTPTCTMPDVPREDIHWLSTADAARILGITNRTLYRFIDEGQLTAYKFGRVIRLKESDVDGFIEASRIEPGTLEHLYPDTGRAHVEANADEAEPALD
jgi:excisionase family DNA binding protein